jgi:nuclear transport factor 2 (NTF2) superfamily protein
MRTAKKKSASATSGTPAPMLAPATVELEYKKLFARFEEAFLTHNMKLMHTCLSPAFVWHLPNGQSAYGREAAMTAMRKRFAMPDGPRFTDSVFRFKGTTVIQTYNVEYRGADGQWRESRGMDIYEIAEGLIVSKDAFWKMLP